MRSVSPRSGPLSPALQKKMAELLNRKAKQQQQQQEMLSRYIKQPEAYSGGIGGPKTPPPFLLPDYQKEGDKLGKRLGERRERGTNLPILCLYSCLYYFPRVEKYIRVQQ